MDVWWLGLLSSPIRVVLLKMTMRWFLQFGFLLFLLSCAPEPPCSVVSYNNENAMNIILFPDGFDSPRQEALGEYIIETIKGKEPFKSRPYFNVYRIENYNTSICAPYRPETIYGGYGSPLPPLNCSVAQVTALVSSCNIEKGKIIIMTSDNVASQTGISYDESGVMFMDMKNQVPEVIQHEFGHFFGLVDERPKLWSYALGAGRQPAPNCVKTAAETERWSRLYSENHTVPQGCAGNPDWYFPEHEAIMGPSPTVEKPYGAFNEWYISTAMDCCYARNRTAYTCEAFFAEFPEWKECRQ
jgi:hypothetical protein